VTKLTRFLGIVPRGGTLPLSVQRDRAIVVSARLVGCQFDDFRPVANRLLMQSLLSENPGKVVVRAIVLGIQLDGLLKIADGAVELPAVAPGNATIVVGLSAAGFELQRLVVFGDRACIVLLAAQVQAPFEVLVVRLQVFPAVLPEQVGDLGMLELLRDIQRFLFS